MKRLFTICVLMGLGLFSPTWGQTFSVAVLEDLSGAECAELSGAVLGGCLDRLFASGLIATNEAVGRVAREAFLVKALGMASAREGYVDYVGLVWIRYVGLPEDPDIRVPEAVAWRLMRVRDGSALAEGSVEPLPPYGAKTEEERRELLTALGRSLADVWTKALSKERG